jgi:4-amino-4-deoxy-L-arabinose transferase-like glycosyltransferase
VGERVVISALLVLILAASLVLQLQRLGEIELTVWDESFHAIVARNLLGHPLKPTLIEQPWLPYDYRDWHANHVWMHKPILPLWTIAASFSVLGVDRFALRLPSAILATACVLLTFLIGRRLVDARAAIVAAAVMATSPAMVALVRGRWFADHVDVSLLFWVELSVLFLLRAKESGRWSDVAICGFAQGCAYLSKSYLALIVTGLSVVAVVLDRPARFGPRKALGILAVAVTTVAPWTIYAFVNYRQEFLFENAAWWHHLAGEWEDWGAPWQRVVFDYLPTLHHVFYVPLAAAALALAFPAIRERIFGLLFLLAWVVGVFVPHLIAPTKTPTATLIAMPPMVLLGGAIVSRALRGDLWSQAAWAGAAVAAIVRPAVIVPPNRGYALESGLASIAAKNPWILWQACIALAGTVLLVAVGRFLERSESRARACMAFRTATVVIALLASAWLFARFGKAALRQLVRSEPSGYSELGDFARANLPPNAVLLVAGKGPYEHQLAMFHADRTAYPVPGRDPSELAAAVRRAGGEPYLVTLRGGGSPLEGLAVVYESRDQGRAIYRLP